MSSNLREICTREAHAKVEGGLLHYSRLDNTKGLSSGVSINYRYTIDREMCTGQMTFSSGRA